MLRNENLKFTAGGDELEALAPTCTLNVRQHSKWIAKKKRGEIRGVTS